MHLLMHTFSTCDLESCLQIAVSTKMHYVQIAICTACTVRTVESCTSFTVYIIALRTALHCIQIALCTNGTVYIWYCVQHCTVYKTALCTKLHYVGCGCYRGPSLSYSRTSTLPDSSTCASATQLSTARVLCST